MSKSRRTRTILQLLAVLLALAATAAGPAQADEPALLHFNHSYGVLDRETADAIEHSAYLKDFANFQVRTTTGAGGEKWTGRYLMGRETYLELFGVGDVPGKDGDLGSAGLGVSVEHAGQLSTVVQRLRDAGVANPVQFLQTRDFGDGKPVPWFDAVLTTDQYDAFGAWGMEYRPEYFADPRGNTGPAQYPGDVSRNRYLSDDYRNHQMRDVTGIRLGVTARDLDSTLPLLRAGGMIVRQIPTGAVAFDGMTAIRFDAVPADQVGLRQIDLALNHPAGTRHVEQIGRSTLTVGPGAHARWTFDIRG
ncbi:hypothetical protein CU254_24125 [Amycolatopsis sp. AA4]|uniref:DUF5829 family protein n=1 Tax=Actinomycetes TaxID=1760 RepID=UPI0001B565FD|nr:MULTISPECIES: DUF5829 family protein [Actinomycetes]ATY13181.1 hypothetical protein CU254_24125 [Amycolatopsis sp. AA4]EFL09081.1 conserved hypothetical protein [Streptomyces sp. AA4]